MMRLAGISNEASDLDSSVILSEQRRPVLRHAALQSKRTTVTASEFKRERDHSSADCAEITIFFGRPRRQQQSIKKFSDGKMEFGHLHFCNVAMFAALLIGCAGEKRPKNTAYSHHSSYPRHFIFIQPMQQENSFHCGNALILSSSVVTDNLYSRSVHFILQTDRIDWIDSAALHLFGCPKTKTIKLVHHDL